MPAAAVGAAPPCPHPGATRPPATRAPAAPARHHSQEPDERRAPSAPAQSGGGLARTCAVGDGWPRPASSFPGRVGTHTSLPGAPLRWRSPVPRRVGLPIMKRRPSQEGQISWPGQGPRWCCLLHPWCPTPGVRRGGQRERGTSGRWQPSPARPCWARELAPGCAVTPHPTRLSPTTPRRTTAPRVGSTPPRRTRTPHPGAGGTGHRLGGLGFPPPARLAPPLRALRTQRPARPAPGALAADARGRAATPRRRPRRWTALCP